MAKAYSPGLLVSAGCQIRRRRILPIAGEVLAKAGDRVASRDVVAKALMPGDVLPVNLARSLGIAARDVPSALKVPIGAPVQKEELLARSGGLFGWFPKEFLSPASGVVESVSRVTGQVLLRGESRAVDVAAYLDGTVVEVVPDEGVIVESYAAVVQGIFGIGGEAYGTLRVACSSREQDLTADRLVADMAGQVVLGGRRVTEEAVHRAIELGVVGLVCGGIDDADLKAILGYDLGVAITGSETIGLTLIVTEGFGQIAMAERTYRLLSQHAGASVSLNGTTQIRAGVIRPEIVIPVPQVNSVAETQLTTGVLDIGAPIRVIREPWFGVLGKVTGLPSEPAQLASGSKSRVAEIRLASGETVLVPRANLELIEG